MITIGQNMLRGKPLLLGPELDLDCGVFYELAGLELTAYRKAKALLKTGLAAAGHHILSDRPCAKCGAEALEPYNTTSMGLWASCGACGNDAVYDTLD